MEDEMNYYGGVGKTDEWYTPKYIFDALNCRFDMDVAAPAGGPRHLKVPKYFTEGENGLVQKWEGCVWMNPPFGGRNGLVPWLDKFFEHGDGVALTPDRTSAPWWQNAAERAEVIHLMRGKTNFEKPDGTLGKSPGDGVTLWAVGQRGAAALARMDGVTGVTLYRL